MRFPHRAPLSLLVVGSLAAAAACGSDADAGAKNKSDETTTSTTEGYEGKDSGSTKIDWEKCKSNPDDKCADVEVPLNYKKPDGDTIKLSVAMVPATGKRVGALFVNPGGPGSTATDLVDQMAHFLPDSVNQQFDIVGVDPRGTGSSKLDCDFDMAKLFGTDPYVTDDDQRDALIDVSKDYSEACESKVGKQLPFMGTRDAARDLDHIRGLLGDDKFNYLGMSYGTILGQAYAQLFPNRIRAMVLDASDPIGLKGLDSATSQAAGFETALKAFAADCDAKTDCPLAPDAMKAVDKLLAETKKDPISAKPRDLGPGEMATAMSLPLYSKDMWPDLAKAVAEGLKGDGTAMVKLADTYLGEVDFDLYYAVNCIDYEWPDKAEGFLSAAKAAGEKSPHFGQPEVNEYLECATWPVEQDPLEASTTPITPAPLVIATTDDPATPYEDGVQTAKQTGGTLLTHRGEGHTSVGEGNKCIDNAVATYLASGKLPAAGTVCT